MAIESQNRPSLLESFTWRDCLIIIIIIYRHVGPSVVASVTCGKQQGKRSKYMALVSTQTPASASTSRLSVEESVGIVVAAFRIPWSATKALDQPALEPSNLSRTVVSFDVHSSLWVAASTAALASVG